jgi:hypothetical protein
VVQVISRHVGHVARNREESPLSTTITTPGTSAPTVVRVAGQPYIAAQDLLEIARRTKLAVSTVVRVLQEVQR